MADTVKIPIAREGYPFIVLVAFIAIAAWAFGWERVAALAFLLTIFVTAFFRDPERKITARPGDILAPADGRVLAVESLSASRYFSGACQRVTIFMSVFNAHVNRIPISGTVEEISYHPGRFLLGFSEKASLENEQNAVRIRDERGRDMTMVQIAGLVARRIICYLNKGQAVQAGERFGLIRFGSRMDLYMPPTADILVVPGDRVKAGLHVVARLQ